MRPINISRPRRPNAQIVLLFFLSFLVMDFCSRIASGLHFYNYAQRHADSRERLYFCPVHLTCPVFRVDVARFSRSAGQTMTEILNGANSRRDGGFIIMRFPYNHELIVPPRLNGK